MNLKFRCAICGFDADFFYEEQRINEEIFRNRIAKIIHAHTDWHIHKVSSMLKGI